MQALLIKEEQRYVEAFLLIHRQRKDGMRRPTREELLKTPPPALRTSSKTTQAYLAIRRKILTGEYAADQALLPKQIEEEYHINNTTTQVLLARLANEGLVSVHPVKERTWPYNASLNDYRVADLTHVQKALLTEQRVLFPEGASHEQVVEKEVLLLKLQYADAEIAHLLALAEGDKVFVYRERQRWTDNTILAIRDLYVPFWFADVVPQLEQKESDLSRLMQRVGKFPASCTETVEVVQASSLERVLFELSPDDPAPLLKLQQQIVDRDGQPLAVQFLTIRGEHYRLRASFSLAPLDQSD
jgi:DNA-binding GntR family transcriptional regulator